MLVSSHYSTNLTIFPPVSAQSECQKLALLFLHFGLSIFKKERAMIHFPGCKFSFPLCLPFRVSHITLLFPLSPVPLTSSLFFFSLRDNTRTMWKLRWGNTTLGALEISQVLPTPPFSLFLTVLFPFFIISLSCVFGVFLYSYTCGVFTYLCYSRVGCDSPSADVCLHIKIQLRGFCCRFVW